MGPMENCGVFGEEFNLRPKAFQHAKASFINPSGGLIQSTGRVLCWYIVNPSQVKRLPGVVVELSSNALQGRCQNVGVEGIEPVPLVGASHLLSNRFSLIHAESLAGTTGAVMMSHNLVNRNNSEPITKTTALGVVGELADRFEDACH